MRNILFLIISIICALMLLINMIGCGGEEEKEEPAKVLKTEPASSGLMSSNGSLTITFDKSVTDVKVNGTPATVDGTKAVWKAQGLSTGGQTLGIQWTDANGNTGSMDLTLTIQAADIAPPKVESISITNGASDVDIDKLNSDGITIKFSEKIDINKSQNALVLLDKSGNQIAWTPNWSEDGTQVVLKGGPKTKLLGGAEYTLAISGYFDNAENEGVKVEIAFSTVGTSIPTDSLKLWLKADVGIKGNDVSGWEDQSGNKANAEQATAKSQPILEKDSVNGMPAVVFDGVDDFMTFTLPINGLTGATIILVSAATNDITLAFPYCQNAAIFWNETASWGTAHLTPLQSTVWFRFGTGQTQTLPVKYDYKTPIGDEFTIATAMMEGETDYLYVNGQLVLTNKKPQGQKTIANQRDVGNLGRGYDDNTYFPGKIAEVLVYARTLTESDRKQIEQYLSNKYSIR
jgi:hypothetical protein